MYIIIIVSTEDFGELVVCIVNACLHCVLAFQMKGTKVLTLGAGR